MLQLSIAMHFRISLTCLWVQAFIFCGLCIIMVMRCINILSITTPQDAHNKLMLQVYLGSNSLELSATWTTYIYFSSWQLWTVALWLIQTMARLIMLLEQHLDRQPPTVVTQATTWWETVLALVKLQEIGLWVHLPVKVCYCTLYLLSFYERSENSSETIFGPKWCFSVAGWQTSICVNIYLLFLRNAP